MMYENAAVLNFGKARSRVNGVWQIDKRHGI